MNRLVTWPFLALVVLMMIGPIWAESDLAKSFEQDMVKAIKDDDHAKIIDLARLAGGNKDLNFKAGWKSKLRDALDWKLPVADWNKRQEYARIAASVDVDFGFDPEAMSKKSKALSMLTTDAREAVSLFDEAMKGHAVATEQEYWSMAQEAAKQGMKSQAFKYTQHLSYGWMQQNKKAFDDFFYNVLKPSSGPTVRPRLLVHTMIGGKGRQGITKVEFVGQHQAKFSGKGFSVTYDLRDLSYQVEGDINTNNTDKMGGRMRLYKGWKKGEGAQTLFDPRNGMTYTAQTQQVHKILQQPYFKTSKGTEMWGWYHSLCEKHALMADSRLYPVWLAPNGMVGGVIWTDGGNTTLGRNPKDIKKKQRLSGGWGKGARLAMILIDPEKGEIKYGKVHHGVVSDYLADPWGRLYVAGSWGGKAGLVVYSEDLKRSVFETSLAGALIKGKKNDNKGIKARMSEMKMHNGYIIMGGYTNVPHLRGQGRKQIQTRGGGELDGVIAIFRVW